MRTRSAREQAIEAIKDARQAHVDWIEFIEEHPDKASKPQARIKTAGDAEHHRDWVEKYDVVLKVLKED